MILTSRIIEAMKTSRSALETCPEVYPGSCWEAEGARVIMSRVPGKPLLATGAGPFIEALQGDVQQDIKIAPRNTENARVLRQFLPVTAPKAHRGHGVTLGLGDRLGLAGPGHLRLLKGKQVFPVLAQQSMRELTLTGRSYTDVLDAATWGVVQTGWTGGYGADGDHLKTADEIRYALDAGFTMITLDCSEVMRNDMWVCSDIDVDAAYEALSQSEREALERIYLGRSHVIPDLSFRYEPTQFRRIVLTYRDALAFAAKVWSELLQPVSERVDFELSIDETPTPTGIPAHFFIASELERRGVRCDSVAPRFCGEFQKGIDYVGDTGLFAAELAEHQAIASAFHYKLSVHSGSDKFSVFPAIGQLPAFHLKTAGTNWLEAVRVIAQADPQLYRDMHKYALAHLQEARAYYVISNGPETIPSLDELTDSELPDLMNRDDARQCLHITYGVLLQAREGDDWRFRNRIYDTLAAQEDMYMDGLYAHIGRHLTGLGR